MHNLLTNEPFIISLKKLAYISFHNEYFLWKYFGSKILVTVTVSVEVLNEAVLEYKKYWSYSEFDDLRPTVG